MTTPAGLASVALRAARAAAAELVPRFGKAATGVSSKSSRTDLVSDADRAAESAILAVLATERPGDAVVAEEGGGSETASAVRWIVDPLDGTINYLWGIPHWSVSIAAVDERGTVAGVVFDPCRDEVFRAVRGEGAWCDDERLTLGPAPELGEALVGTGFNYRAEERARQAPIIADLLSDVRDIRRFGSAALDLAWVAAGRLDVFFERGVEIWDWTAGALLVVEAGGVATPLAPTAERPAGIIAGPRPLVETLRARVET
jgi:myo-inositol-1(or 4)-monophosphatase